jgi:hypothetical protein
MFAIESDYYFKARTNTLPSESFFIPRILGGAVTANQYPPTMIIYEQLKISTLITITAHVDNNLPHNRSVTNHIIGDGNCCTRSLAEIIYHSQDHHTQLRAEICRFINTNALYFTDLNLDLPSRKGSVNLVEYLQAKKQIANSAKDVDQYGDETMILAMALFYQRRIVVYSPLLPAQNKYQVTIFLPLSLDGTNKQDIYIFHKNNNHFEILTNNNHNLLDNGNIAPLKPTAHIRESPFRLPKPTSLPLDAPLNKKLDQLVGTTSTHFVCLNVRSIMYNETKQACIIQYIIDSLHKDPIDMLCLTETWIHDPDKLSNWIEFSPIGKDYTVISDSLIPYSINDANSNGQGTCIILRKNWLPFLHKEQILRIPGRVTGLVFKRLKETYFISCIYLPPKSKQRSKEYRHISRTLMRKLKKLPENAKIIIELWETSMK